MLYPCDQAEIKFCETRQENLGFSLIFRVNSKEWCCPTKFLIWKKPKTPSIQYDLGPKVSFSFNHDKNKTIDYQNGKDSTENEDCESMEEETEEIEENQCHLCMKKLENREHLWKHFESKHEHFYSLMQKNAPLS